MATIKSAAAEVLAAKDQRLTAGPVPVPSSTDVDSTTSNAPPADIDVCFGDFRLNLRAAELFRNGVRIKVQEQPLQILACLVDRPGEMVGRQELCAKVWPDGIHVDFAHCLKTAVHKLRRALGDSPRRPRYVETVSTRGYRFIAAVERSVRAPVLAVHPAHLVPAPSRTSRTSVSAQSVRQWAHERLSAPSAPSEAQFDQFLHSLVETQQACFQSWAELVMTQVELWRLLSPRRSRGAKKAAYLPAPYSEAVERHLQALSRFIDLLTPDQQVRIHHRALSGSKGGLREITLKAGGAANCINRTARRRLQIRSS